ncbi:MAG: ATP-binding protein [Kiritimatiellae bacterium]|nr:ATP-binding protein [Kiritimatiellia bacterium]MBR5588309.1 ATP-binding protein [Kiritimatiellia bacterium]
MEIQRQFYLNELVRKQRNGFVKVITGLRRCGKSYLLRTIFKNQLLLDGVSPESIIEIAFDERDNKPFCNPDTFYAFAKKRLEEVPKAVFLLDEIQLLEDFESVLNGLLNKGAEIYATGSNAKFLSKDIITEFRGRGDEIHMMPLSFAEYFSIFNDDKVARFQEYMLYGGLPLVALSELPEDKIAMLNSLYTETYLRDIVGRNKIRKVSELENLLDILSSSIGSLVNPEKLRKTFHSVKHSKITTTTITKYLTYLEDAYLLEAAQRYDIKGKAYIETPQKYYYSDLGLRNARLNFRQLEETHSMENIIYNELRLRKYNVDIGQVTIHERGANGLYSRKQLEVDFVANKGSKRYYIQSAYLIPDEVKREQEIKSLLKIDDTFKKVVITSHAPAPLYDEHGILTMSIYDFLLNPNSLDF